MPYERVNRPDMIDHFGSKYTCAILGDFIVVRGATLDELGHNSFCWYIADVHDGHTSAIYQFDTGTFKWYQVKSGFRTSFLRKEFDKLID